MEITQPAEVIGVRYGVETDQARRFMDEFERMSSELLATTSRAADAAQRRRDEIDRDLAEIGRIIAGAA